MVRGSVKSKRKRKTKIRRNSLHEFVDHFSHFLLPFYFLQPSDSLPLHVFPHNYYGISFFSSFLADNFISLSFPHPR
jgi:hypothetical protein